MTRHETDPISGTDMADVDRSDDPSARVAYLDSVTEQSIELKIDSYSMLELDGGQKVLDVGCGTGDDVRRMAAIVGRFGRAVGIDLSEEMIEQARQRSAGEALPVEFVQGSAYDLPFPDDSFDACRCERVLQHLDDPLAAIGEMRRVTRPGGLILLVDPDFGAAMIDTSHPEIYERIRESNEQLRSAEPGDGWRGRQLWGLAHQAGLESIQLEGRVVALSSFAAANPIAGIDRDVNAAIDSGAISRRDAATYLEDLRERDATSRFLAAIPGFFVVGRVPEGRDRRQSNTCV